MKSANGTESGVAELPRQVNHQTESVIRWLKFDESLFSAFMNHAPAKSCHNLTADKARYAATHAFSSGFTPEGVSIADPAIEWHAVADAMQAFAEPRP